MSVPREMKDFGRTHLVSVLVCTDCGNPLNASYDKPKSGGQFDGSITGAAKVEQVIAIHPCEHCLGAARRPLRLMREALKSFDSGSVE
jgi:hypothetical protein